MICQGWEQAETHCDLPKFCLIVRRVVFGRVATVAGPQPAAQTDCSFCRDDIAALFVSPLGFSITVAAVALQ